MYCSVPLSWLSSPSGVALGVTQFDDGSYVVHCVSNKLHGQHRGASGRPPAATPKMLCPASDHSLRPVHNSCVCMQVQKHRHLPLHLLPSLKVQSCLVIHTTGLTTYGNRSFTAHMHSVTPDAACNWAGRYATSTQSFQAPLHCCACVSLALLLHCRQGGTAPHLCAILLVRYTLLRRSVGLPG